eukprot:10773809-Prorocentrum_lima.AAC.1
MTQPHIWFDSKICSIGNCNCGFQPELVGLLSTHIDDIKGGASDKERQLILAVTTVVTPRSKQESLTT